MADEDEISPTIVTPIPVSVSAVDAALERSSLMHRSVMPATAIAEPMAKRVVGRCPRSAHPSNVLGISRSAKMVATTPEVMCRSAR